MAIFTLIVFAFLIRCLAAQADLVLPACATGCVNNSSRAPPVDQACAPGDISCLCLNTWWFDVHDCALTTCDPENAKKTDDWAKERCMKYPSPPPTSTIVTSVVTLSISTIPTSPSSSFSSPPTSTSSTPSSTSRVISTSSDSASASAEPSDSSSTQRKHPPSHTSVGLAAGIPCAILFITSVTVLYCLRRRCVARRVPERY